MAELKPSAASIDVGRRLQALRGQSGLSQRALADASRLSPNALSQIERNAVSPTVSTLTRLAAALEVPITAFFDVGDVRRDIAFVKADERTRVPFARGLMEGLGGELFTGLVEPFYLTLEAGGSSGPQPVVHTGHEFVFCLRGVLEYAVGNCTFQLESGDSLLFASHLHHRWRNPGGMVTDALIVLFGFAEDERPTRHHLAVGE
jgi:transcriptional regulator with XRE-family HTH domain